jgi:long-chain acyl-CoA synthetase
MSGRQHRSIPDMLRNNAKEFSARAALKYRKQGVFVTLTYAAFYERALMVARGLGRMHVKPGDRIAILSENRVGWVIADMGILCSGGVTVPIYPSNTPEQIGYMINNSGARIVFVSGKFQYTKLLKVRDSIPGVALVVSFERFLGDQSLPVTTFYQLSEIDSPVSAEEKKEIEAGIDRINPDGMLTLVYTSGTTGIPKGVMLSHNNILTNTRYLTEHSGAIGKDDTLLSFLPLSHILERTAGYYLPICNGALMALADSIEKVTENMAEIRPTVMICVPRLFEKIYHRIFENVHQKSAVYKALFHWGVDVGKKYVAATYIDKHPATMLNLEYAVADRLIFSRIRARFGGNMKLFSSGGAPLDKTINEFFWIIGIPIFEGYGLTETSPTLCLNNFDHIRFGSVGVPLKQTEFKIADDGEILVKGPQVMLGYYNDPSATAEVIQDGWLKTGDIGYIEEGFVYITDRKKELIITAGGKNIAPQPIENALRMDKYVTSAFVCGDRKPYLTALIVPNLERLLEFAKEKHIHYYELDDLVMHEPVQKLFEQRVAAINSRLAPYETIKKFVLLVHDFSIEGGELTPTLKMKRKIIYEKYKQWIEDLYSDHNN